ncbi:MAG: D-2-hydroxyacid dehydrogenase [Fournierella sp.]|uniref:D-2-hydroxyacid dehydrogenase n=1 Tax=Allofournierella sp. TaxID=1940256 RepID=UPI002A805F89|nr:D-2-hydroxyacid dehydrogenase [Fournierella sp.]MDY4166423.1 D-2-hydroxyacid dehydrogenase [Fournierella sp.]
MKIVVLDSYCVRPGDLDWTGLYDLADVVEEYPRTPPEQLIDRLRDADFAVSNKCRIDDAVLDACPRLRWVGLTATGTDSLDLEACHRHGVAVANVPGYSTESVAQHGFALLLELANSIAGRAASLRDGYWQTGVPDSYGIHPHFELAGRTFGVVGYGAIGRAAARIAKGFGMWVLAYTRHVKPEYAADGVEFVPFEQLLEDSDVVSLHCPATAETRGIINEAALAAMKPGAILLNTARGALVDEAAVCAALKSGHLGYYASDVAAHEPVRPKDELLHCPNVLLTPHVAWATQEALARLSAEVCANLEAFLQGERRNLV